MLGSRFLGDPLAGGMPRWKYVANRFLTGVENLAFGLHLSEYHTGLRAYSRHLLETIPYQLNSDDFVFDQELIAQVVAAGMRRRIGEIARADALLRGGVARSVSGAASSTGCRRCGSSLRYMLHRLARAAIAEARARDRPADGDADGHARSSRRRARSAGALGIAISVVAIWLLVRVGRHRGGRAGPARRRSPAWIARDGRDRARRRRGPRRSLAALLAPIAPVPYRRVLGYTYIGYLANNVLPARLGELYRSHALGEGEGISRTTVLGTVVVERVVDTSWSSAIAAAGGPRPERPRRDDQRRPARAARSWRCSSSCSALGIVAHRLPGADRVARVSSSAAAAPGTGAAAARRAGGRRPAADARRRRIVFSAVAWTASIADVPGRGPGGRRRADRGPGARCSQWRRPRHDRARPARATSARSS